MVSRDDEDREFSFSGGLLKKMIECRDGGFRRKGAVKEVARNQQCVRLSVVDEFDEALQLVNLVFDEASTVKLSAKMPVRGVKEAEHARVPFFLKINRPFMGASGSFAGGPEMKPFNARA